VSDENTISITFAEKVEIKKEYVPTEDIMNLGHLAELLYSTKTAEVTYEVKRGDTWSEIAQDHGLTSNELLSLNPGYNINKLAIGEILTLSASVPYLTMTVVQQERYVADVPYQIEYTDDASMYQGDTKVTSPGSFGAADTVANVTYVNGQEIQRTILSSVTLKEPVTEQQLRGTKERPTWYPTGSFRWPTTGRITSSFGGRKSPGGIGSTNHKGLDIANSRGTAIYAADGGTVTYAGWMGGYGYTVKIRHKDGYAPLYAHNSKLLVSAGSHVYKGQQIAKMGSTGNSTGSHCHFEIRINGVAKNPMNYL
jgi:murein DD-endopeptidase MepM/ murein hydrolase activator NlpD